VVAEATPSAPGASTEYVVQPGDTLRSIALEQYGDAEQWQRIYQANRAMIGANPDALVAGSTLTIPPPQ
jgi:nucleoid-associated protein YgaU